jgi:hypothetical protein
MNLIDRFDKLLLNMEIRINEKFRDKLLDQIEYISRDKPMAALNFYDELMELIKKIPNHPFKHRQSIYSNDLNVRDLIFKGYTVTFKIIEDEEIIEVFSLIKHQKK